MQNVSVINTGFLFLSVLGSEAKQPNALSNILVNVTH
jgi:hypothetical protein